MGYKIITFIERFLFLFIPFILIANVGGIRNKLQLFKSRKKSNKAIGTLLVIIFMSIIFVNLPNFYSTQFKQEKLVASVKLEADKKIKADAKVQEEAQANAKLLTDAKAKLDAQAKNEAKLKVDAQAKAE
ncbi:hypothetical protein K9O30_14765 [Clostridium bowmanii]|uniref:hypothetical protein n=1 Tax=Clostridium bowmanii TaxID=132925 RepID=UPI001C0E0262|nr:hypothetical protein [Clostridium bowmanii]MBU3190448.1 hypothetical protein [Clostridium bowmanii]MCA1074962.1 hypothetical protein [Clostridium bowmanii]